MVQCPLTTSRRRLGAFNLGHTSPGSYALDQLEIFKKLTANHVAVAVEERVEPSGRGAYLQEEVSRGERDRLKLLLDVNNLVVSNLSLTELFKVIPRRVRLAMQCDGACLSLPDVQKQQLEIHGLDFPGGRGFLQEEGRSCRSTDRVRAKHSARENRFCLTPHRGRYT